MKKIHTCPRYTAGLTTVYRNSHAVSRPAEREHADPAAGRLTTATARYTMLWPRYTAAGGADGEQGRRTGEGEVRTGGLKASRVTGCLPGTASMSSRSFGLHGP
jgi:hypothetical protein